MAIIERHTSPDGVLELVVERMGDGDLAVGFADSASHTHGDILTDTYGGTPESAVRAYVNDVISSRLVIVISRMGGNVQEAWISDDPTRDEQKYAEPGETIEKRCWDGQPADASVPATPPTP
jgi:hypothetical protein